MPPSAAHRDAETRFRALLEDAELPAPDSVAYEEDSIVCFWDEPKLAVVVELSAARPAEARLPSPGGR